MKAGMWIVSALFVSYCRHSKEHKDGANMSEKASDFW